MTGILKQALGLEADNEDVMLDRGHPHHHHHASGSGVSPQVVLTQPSAVSSENPITPHNTRLPSPSKFPAVGSADVAIYWDYENVKIPNWCPATKAAESIRAQVMKYGRIVEKRLYYDSRQPAESSAPRSELDLSGFTLVDCPSRNRKETLDKKLIVDVLCFAWERASMGAKACIVLITSDGDYSYAVARLRDIGVFAVIIHRANVAKVLIDNANVVMSWEFDVLGGPPQTLDDDEEEEDTEDEEGAETKAEANQSGSAVKVVNTDSSPVHAPEHIPSPAKKKATTQRTQAQCALFCSVLLNSQYQTVKEGISPYSSWANEATTATNFYEKLGVKNKEKYQELRKLASDSGYIEYGRRNLKAPGKPVIKVDGREGRAPHLSLESYLRLTYSGMTVVDPNITAKESDWKMVLPKTRPSTKDDNSSVGSDSAALSPCKDGRLFVGGLNWRTTEDSLRSHFKQFGPLRHVILMDGRGYGFVYFHKASDAQRCLDKPGGHEVDNKVIE